MEKANVVQVVLAGVILTVISSDTQTITGTTRTRDSGAIVEQSPVGITCIDQINYAGAISSFKNL